MSSRRRARTGRRAQSLVGGVPVEFADQLDPFWRDAAQIRSRFPDYFTDQDERRLRMGARVYHSVASRWCLDNGFSDPRWPNTADYRALRAALGQDT